ncbi:MAG: hypothetical protein Q9181_005691 [Wetmoreana brouardii]
MSLKRKRSIDTLSPSSASSSSIFDSSRDTSPIAFHYPFRHDASVTDTALLPRHSQAQGVVPAWPEHTSSSINSRTKKRLRNNRPAEAEVFASTYNRLFSAARSSHSVPANPPSHHQQTLQSAPPAPRQSSLHNFWSLPAPPTSTAPAANNPTSSGALEPRVCEDCDAPLMPSSGEVLMGGMDTDGDEVAMDEDELRCRGCRKMVCATCAVVETGMGRECLECRMS